MSGACALVVSVIALTMEMTRVDSFVSLACADVALSITMAGLCIALLLRLSSRRDSNSQLSELGTCNAHTRGRLNFFMVTVSRRNHQLQPGNVSVKKNTDMVICTFFVAIDLHWTFRALHNLQNLQPCDGQ